MAHVDHPQIARRKEHGVHTTAREHTGFNGWLAVTITNLVATMWCAYLFTILALISLPEAIRGGTGPLVAWIAQTFLQLVLLSIIMVGQNVQAAAADKRAEATFHDASATLHEVAHVQGHLAAQDELLTRISEKLGLDPVPVIDNPAVEDAANSDPQASNPDPEASN